MNDTSEEMMNAITQMEKLCEDLDSLKLSETELLAQQYGITMADKSLSEQSKKLYYCYQFTKRQCFQCKNPMLIEGDNPCDSDDEDLVMDEDDLCFKISSSRRYFNSISRDPVPTYPRHYPTMKDLRTIKVKGTKQSVYDFMRSQKIMDEQEHERKMDVNMLVTVMDRYVETEASHYNLDVNDIRQWKTKFGNLVLAETIVCNLMDVGVNLYRNLYVDVDHIIKNLDIMLIAWKRHLSGQPSIDESIERMIVHLNEFNKLAESRENSHYIITIKITMIRHLNQSLQPHDLTLDRLHGIFQVYFGHMTSPVIRGFIPNDWNNLILSPIPHQSQSPQLQLQLQQRRDACILAYEDFLTEITTRTPQSSVYDAYYATINAYIQNGLYFHYIKLGRPIF